MVNGHYKHELKNVWAVVTGILVGVFLSLFTDFILEKIGVFPDPSKGLFVTWMLILATIYRSIYTGLGGYTTAVLSATNPKRNVWILGSIALAVNFIAIIATWNMNLGPHWYPIALTILALPSALIGGWLRWER